MLLEVGVAQHADLLQKGRPLAPETALGQRVAAEVQRQWCFDGRRPAFEVLEAQQAAVSLPGTILNFFGAVILINLLCHKAPVPGLYGSIYHCAARLREALSGANNAFIRRRERRQAEKRTRRRHLPVRQPDFGGRRPLLTKQVLYRHDGLHGARNQRKTIAGISQSGGQHLGQGPGSMVPQHGQPGCESAWHRCRQQPDTGYLLQTQCAKSVGRCRRRSRPLAADGQHAALALTPQQDRCFSAGTVEVRLDHLQDEAASHSGIESVAAAFQHAHGRL